MRVLHTSRFGPGTIGGTERYVVDAALATAGLGVESRWLTSDRGGSHAAPPFPWTSVPTVGPDFYMAARSRSSLRAALRDVDLVHVHDLRFAFAALVAGADAAAIPVLVSTHGLIFHNDRRRLIKSVMWRTRLRPLLQRMRVVLADSESDLEQCRRAGVHDNVRLFENPVNIDPFVAVGDRAATMANRTPDGQLRLLCYGRIDRNKNLAAAVALCGLDDRVVLRVAGHGSQAEMERALAVVPPSVRARIQLLGRVSDDELRREMAQADCIVFPSTYEGFGLALVEAMATGRPIVANDIAPHRSIIADSGVRTCDVNDPPAFLAAILEACKSHPSASAQERASTYSWSRRAPVLVEIYHEVINA